MITGEVLSLATLVLIVGQAGAVAYWGGRLSATLEGLAHRVGQLERTLTQPGGS